jgi:hypothetical protein
MVSSIAGFAFSAPCGAVFFHLMFVCSIAIQRLSVTALWRSIDWRIPPIILVGDILGVPAGAHLLLHLPTSVYRDIISSTRQNIHERPDFTGLVR